MNMSQSLQLIALTLVFVAMMANLADGSSPDDSSQVDIRTTSVYSSTPSFGEIFLGAGTKYRGPRGRERELGLGRGSQPLPHQLRCLGAL